MDVQVLSEQLRRWRWREAMAAGVPPHQILTNAALDGLLRAQPGTLRELAEVPGMTDALVGRHGQALVRLILEASDVKGAPLLDPAFSEAGAGRDALRGFLTDVWSTVAASAASAMASDEPIPTASGKSLLYVDAVTGAAITYRAGKAGPHALTRRDLMGVARRVLAGAGRPLALEELGTENPSHVVVFLGLTPYFETLYDRKVTIRARVDALDAATREAAPGQVE
ncbi:MAG TPA: HRDC domain-containing protein [Candidatus Thermoplasmatota archaeon]|nr:HRDC domain-containing protein [Candidatus Thermoplasmatota archaeon]